jgi:hypothetical protein
MQQGPLSAQGCGVNVTVVSKGKSVWHHPGHLKPIRTVAEYAGEQTVLLAATQLPLEYSRSQATKIVDEWVEFFASEPTPIRQLHFVTRTPKRLFAALGGQTQLQALFVKWGDYEDLTALEGLTQLETLRLAGASSVRSLTSLTRLTGLRNLEIEGLKHVHDCSPLQELRNLDDLTLGGDWMSPRIAHIDSIGWLPALQGLRSLVLHTMIVDDLDYHPLLALSNLRTVRVMKARGMRPTIQELEQRLPWSA